jgi:hypothetical protein
LRGYGGRTGMNVYVVVSTYDYIPYAEWITPDKDEAIAYAMKQTKEWGSGDTDTGSMATVYFNQKEYGNMADSITVFEMEL